MEKRFFSNRGCLYIAKELPDAYTQALNLDEHNKFELSESMTDVLVADEGVPEDLYVLNIDDVVINVYSSTTTCF